MVGSAHKLFLAWFSVLGGSKAPLNVSNVLSSEPDLGAALVPPCERSDCVW